MGTPPTKDRIPLPPVLLSVAAALLLPLAAAIGFACYQFAGRIGFFVGAAIGLAVPLAWLATRVRR